MPIIQSQFKAAWWLANPHLQTLWPTFFKKRPQLDLTSEKVELDDGDFLDLKWTKNHSDKVVIVIHGLEGSLESHYVPSLIKQLSDENYKVCFMHLRGCGDQHNRLARSYHSGASDDLEAVVNHIDQQLKMKIHAAIGFSLGGNLLLKWLGEQGDKARVNRAIAISVPFELNDAALRLKKGFSTFYQKHLVTRLQKRYKEKFETLGSPLKINVNELQTFHQFDDQVTAPLNGFKDVDDYYQQSSSKQFIKHIKVNTLILHDYTDPFMFRHTAPKEDDLSNSVTLELTENAGHVGFIEGDILGVARYWAEKRISEWLVESPSS